jgi:hypothetical protein
MGGPRWRKDGTSPDRTILEHILSLIERAIHELAQNLGAIS